MVAAASRTGEIEWAHMSLKTFKVDKDNTFDDLMSFKQIYPGSKLKHFRRLHEDSKIPYSDMIFFDDCRMNTREVSSLGVFCVYNPNGLTDALWKQGIAAFAAKRAKGDRRGATFSL
uniref:Magnesium-dependent phosphatase-1 n=2 Tax=Lotharella globosa TaxID=91324 RepID=A0A7S3Z079_9EUKA